MQRAIKDIWKAALQKYTFTIKKTTTFRRHGLLLHDGGLHRQRRQTPPMRTTRTTVQIEANCTTRTIVQIGANCTTRTIVQMQASAWGHQRAKETVQSLSQDARKDRGSETGAEHWRPLPLLEDLLIPEKTGSLNSTLSRQDGKMAVAATALQPAAKSLMNLSHLGLGLGRADHRRGNQKRTDPGNEQVRSKTVYLCNHSEEKQPLFLLSQTLNLKKFFFKIHYFCNYKQNGKHICNISHNWLYTKCFN